MTDAHVGSACLCQKNCSGHQIAICTQWLPTANLHTDLTKKQSLNKCPRRCARGVWLCFYLNKQLNREDKAPGGDWRVLGKGTCMGCAHQVGLTCLRQFNCATQTPSSVPCSSALSAPKPFAVEQNWSVYVKAAYVASHPRVLTLKYHEIATLLWELGTFLNRGQLAITGRRGCIFNGILHVSPDPPHLDKPRVCWRFGSRGKCLWRPCKNPGSAFERKNPAGRDAGAFSGCWGMFHQAALDPVLCFWLTSLLLSRHIWKCWSFLSEI